LPWEPQFADNLVYAIITLYTLGTIKYLLKVSVGNAIEYMEMIPGHLKLPGDNRVGRTE
jgi:hypothetical protein